ncbi:MAG: DNA-processing protein DprA [Chitinophagaceae bacterium]|jgi:DNA processing protein|nr:DNA-processing protein DprA [Chitinophagaceae bacterium]
MNSELLYEIALTLVPNIGTVQAKILMEQFGRASDVFKAKQHTLETIENIGRIRASSIRHFTDFSLAEEEIKFIEKYAIAPLFLNHPNYPKRLLNCYDPPTMLYYKGNTDLNTTKIVAVIGTRSNSAYGKEVTEKLMEAFQNTHILIVSGMAIGIDAIAHKSALANGLPTVGVLAHGLQTIYPPVHKSLAKDMVMHGGLLTEFMHDAKPDKHNFPRRNRIVAGMADATIVVETAIKGGSMITAELAGNYNRDVFAVPGKTTDAKSAGCNYLIQSNKAILYTDGSNFLEVMNWVSGKTTVKKQRELFIELSAEETIIVNILKEKEETSIDELNLKSELSSSRVAAAILNLELQNVIVSLPGKMYRMVD